MSQLENASIVLNSHPDGAATLENFRLESSVLKPLRPGEFLVKNRWLSIDPYIRPRLNKSTMYVSSIKLGEVIPAETIGEIVESQNPLFNVGDLVFTISGWQKYYVGDKQNFIVNRLPVTSLPPSIFLGVVGTPGRSAYFGLNKIAKPKAGETLVVSAASGSVGSVVGQLGKLAGCHVVGLAGSDEKCRYVVEESGFDACLNYKTADLNQDLRDACPHGIDIYFENVGGRVSLFVAKLLNEGARVPICGNAANYNKGTDVDTSGPANFFSSLPDAPLNRFFLVTEWFKDYAESDAFLLDLVEKGVLKYRETITDGLENAPQSFIDLLDGKHLGKQLIRMC
ncbi:NADP-dependent oxidoreductase [Brenneria goodwinii]|uniref:NADP-dependent oxidoreductase n=1 Tax=Brenneria goodwinii TaxID=1109412 RepID=UPI000EF22A44|nr:NADP-dependent oxidoreductase [Brenneria goodwinii]MCG8155396.1 NADP-dependent oxidoreductase [Brenneria goodwinii]MCG8161596.1 NADP-dependent oxidoreductase [Brenneria goodwinii]MCG8166057.1 NADP-dependent oxidoreductase [Brenneria goodwinii]MCG8169243.1 NADP-dependent oxidoreductase [Brenneria goodwinii]MCG8175753.1 NADP-dependent oxidoreductase [Brenneria goodwinii]